MNFEIEISVNSSIFNTVNTHAFNQELQKRLQRWKFNLNQTSVVSEDILRMLM
jgi:hypothetical protein